MEYSIFDYGVSGILFPVAIFFVIIMGAFFVSKHLISQKYHWYTIIFVWVIVLVWILYSIFTYSSGFTYPISAVLQTDEVQYITIGTIEQIQSALSPPKFYNPISKNFCPATFVTVDGVRFYLPYCDLEVGQTIELRWATENCVVYSYNILSADEIRQSCTFPITAPIFSQQHTVYAQSGKVLVIVSAALFILLAVLQYPLGKAMAPYFVKKDREVTDMVRPNRFGLLYVCVPIVLVFGIVGGLVLRGFAGAMIIFLIGTVLIGRQVLKKQTTTVFLEGDLLIVKDWETSYQIERDSVETIRFLASRLPHNRCLTLTLKNGMVFRFEQENFYGLENIYAKMSNPSE